MKREGDGDAFMAEHGLNPEDVTVPDGLPRMLLWRVLVIPVQPKQQTTSGIILATETQDAEKALQFIGRVAGVGPLAGKSAKFRDENGQLQWPVKVGDWVVYGRYAGQRCEYKGTRLLLMNDDEILGVADGPEGFRIYV